MDYNMSIIVLVLVVFFHVTQYGQRKKQRKEKMETTEKMEMTEKMETEEKKKLQ